MPKIISRSNISASTDAQPTASSAAALRVYYCICGEFILVIDKSLSSLPRRKTDNSTVIRCQSTDSAPARVFKLNATAGDAVLIERQGGHERQYRFCCPRCTLPVGYQSTPAPFGKSGPFMYIFPGALTQMQGQVPPNALEPWSISTRTEAKA
ncbi:hypothetical protein Moror_7465 [Moniliophthora roreri MCA 2997]|uniref:STEEP1 domain-containing protein n=1 Tax=Moniliophthora roreri (strain MCA 2997) TaxID=1381753 RepID=V2XUD3_MONRO|nr:hypothetical protein Moror_7465 [Moniliophthora roreri MCA 2997]KAI3612313.1 hypothetical protein WG66_012195 [Moniliophthora roreri]